MHRILTRLALLALAAASLPACANGFDNDRRGGGHNANTIGSVQLGPRPFFLADDMADSPLKRRLQHCAATREHFRPTLFSIGHRGAALQFPEHTRESYEAAARSGAGIVECDVTFTKDKELVCRHAQNDLHTTTNILATPLASKCIKPFTPAVFDAAGTPSFRTDINAGPTSGTLLTLKEAIALFKQLGVKMTPELKSPSVPMPFDGFTQAALAQKMIDEHKAAGVPARDVWAQSFDINDVLYWVRNEPAFGRQAVYLDDANVVADLPSFEQLKAYRAAGIHIVAPPLFALLTADTSGNILPSQYARNAKAAGLDIITWTLERSGILADGDNGFYFQTFDSAIKREGDVYRVLDVLAEQIGVLGVFSDWPATTSFYANCTGQK
jgi:glycerophosphoryl diester phosphodiesterase